MLLLPGSSGVVAQPKNRADDAHDDLDGRLRWHRGPSRQEPAQPMLTMLELGSAWVVSSSPGKQLMLMMLGCRAVVGRPARARTCMVDARDAWVGWRGRPTPARSRAADARDARALWCHPALTRTSCCWVSWCGRPSRAPRSCSRWSGWVVSWAGTSPAADVAQPSPEPAQLVSPNPGKQLMLFRGFMLAMLGFGWCGRPLKREPAQRMIIMLGFAQPSPESQLMPIMLGLGCVTQLLQAARTSMLAQPSAEPAQPMLMMLRFRGVLGRTQRS